MTAKYRQVTRLTRGVNGRVKRTAQLVLERRPVVGDMSAQQSPQSVCADVGIRWAGQSPASATAMAASLGFEVYLVKGDNWQGWCWKRAVDDSCSCDRPYGDFETCELAALDALRFDAGKRGTP